MNFVENYGNFNCVVQQEEIVGKKMVDDYHYYSTESCFAVNFETADNYHILETCYYRYIYS